MSRTIIKHGSFFISLLASSLVINVAKAQFAEDAFRFSEEHSQGTARFQALGGAHTSLGGDPTSITANPAGLGFYTRKELSISLGNDYTKSTSQYLGQSLMDTKSSFNLKNLSLVIANNPHEYSQSKWTTSLGVSFNRQHSFNKRYSFNGRNENSAFVDYIVGNANARGYTKDELNSGYYSNPNTGQESYDLLEGVYYNLYMFDPVNNDDKAPYVAVEANGAVNQSGYYESRGSRSQWNFGFAGNYQDKLYLGISVGFPRITSQTDRVLDEVYTTPQYFRSSQFWETIDITGSGFNATIGAIYRVDPSFQVGLTVSTPTYMRFRRTLYDGASVELLGSNTINQPTSLVTNPWDYEYNQLSPFRSSLGATWFLPNKVGFVTASADFVGYKGMNLKPVYSGQTLAEYNGYIDAWYKNTINPKVGIELRHQQFRVRGGFAYYSDPYKAKVFSDLKESAYSVSGGLGYKGSRFYADLAVVAGKQHVPFTVYPGADGYSTYNNVTSMVTLGMNF